MEINQDTHVQELDDGSIEVGTPEVEVKEPDTDNQEDEHLGQTDDQEDEQGHAEETAEEAEARRQRNRDRRAQNKANRKNYVESLRRELAARDRVIEELSGRVASVEQSSTSSQIAQLDGAINEAATLYNQFKEINRQAIEQADGVRAVDAQEKMFLAQQRHNMLVQARKKMGQTVTQPKPLDPRVANHAQDWMNRNSWFDPSGGDVDSEIATRLDARLVAEGWNPSTPEYWEELDSRVKKYLPHRASMGYNKTSGKPRAPVAGQGGETSTKSKGTYRLSAERVNAMKEAGIYDDPVKRADMIRRYQEEDKLAAQSK